MPLGLPDAPARSTLAYANEHRPWQLYQSVFHQLLARCREVAGGHGFRFKNKLLSLDATLIELCASVFDWAQYRRTKGAVKLHLLLDHQGLLPSYAVLTEGRVHESRIAPTLRFEPGTIVVFDRGYNDYDWFAALDQQGVFFVTRMKGNTDYGVLERCLVTAEVAGSSPVVPAINQLETRVYGNVHIFHAPELGAGGFDCNPSENMAPNASFCAARFCLLAACWYIRIVMFGLVCRRSS